MKYRQLGKTGPRVSAIGMGRGSQPVRLGEALEQEFNAAIHRALDLGINLFDSSDAYWGARHEVLLGRALQGRRDEAQIIAKFGNIDLPDGKNFKLEDAPRESRTLFTHSEADARFGASVFWLRDGMLSDKMMQMLLETWQTKRDGTKRGIVEIKS